MLPLLHFVSLICVASFPLDGSESQGLGDERFQNELSIAQPFQEETLRNPTNPISFNELESPSPDQQQELSLSDNTSSVDGCIPEDSTIDRGVLNGKSLNSRDARACPSGFKKAPLPVEVVPISPAPMPSIQKQPPQPVRHGSGSDGENPCLLNLYTLEYPMQTMHVSCGSHPVGHDPVYPAFVLNCVHGKPLVRPMGLI